MNKQSLQSIKEIPVNPENKQSKSHSNINESNHHIFSNPNLTNEEKEERKSTKKGTNTSLGIRVCPEIFVALKKGSLEQHYVIGKTLGEGSNFFLFIINL